MHVDESVPLILPARTSQRPRGREAASCRRSSKTGNGEDIRVPRITLYLPKLKFLLRDALNSSNLLLQWQNRRLRSQRRDAERIDLLVRLRVVALDVREIGRLAAERWVFPVEVTDPSERSMSKWRGLKGAVVSTYLCRAGYPLRMSLKLVLKCWT